MIGSDGSLTKPGDGAPHPRAFGTYPRVLGRYVRERGVLTLEEAVRKMTSFPAARLGLVDRGVLKAGMMADITVFDAATIADKATFTYPHHYSEGVRYVAVNGQVTVAMGAHTGVAPDACCAGLAQRLADYLRKGWLGVVRKGWPGVTVWLGGGSVPRSTHATSRSNASRTVGR